MEIALPLTGPSKIKRATPRGHEAAIITAPRNVEIRDIPLPPVEPGTVRVRVTHCGVCASNVPPWEGRPWFQYPMQPGALGHEAIGEIDEVAENVEGWEPGDRVAYIGERGYAQYEVVPVSALFRVPENLGDNLFLAEPLACAMNVFRRSNISAGDHVAVVGAGFLALLVTQLAAAAGAYVTVIARRPDALELAKQFGAAGLLHTERAAVVQQLAEATGGEMCDVVIEATGSQEPLDLAAELTRIRGRLVIAGYHQDGMRTVNMQLWNWRGFDVISAHERDTAVYLEGMQLAAEALASGRLTTRGLITHQFPLEELGTALDLAAKRPEGFVKGVIRL
jgi:NADPH:quinone reductase